MNEFFWVVWMLVGSMVTIAAGFYAWDWVMHITEINIERCPYSEKIRMGGEELISIREYPEIVLLRKSDGQRLTYKCFRQYMLPGDRIFRSLDENSASELSLWVGWEDQSFVFGYDPEVWEVVE